MERLLQGVALFLGIGLIIYNVYCLVDDKWSFVYSNEQFLVAGLITVLVVTSRWLEQKNVDSRLNDQEYLMKLVTEWITTEEE